MDRDASNYEVFRAIELDSPECDAALRIADDRVRAGTWITPIEQANYIARSHAEGRPTLFDGHTCDKKVATDHDLIFACSQCGTEYA